MSNDYKTGADVPNDVLANRLNELAHDISKGNLRQFSMRVPAEVDFCPDLVMCEAARRLKALSQPQEAVAWTCNDINFDNIDKSFEQFCKDNLILSPMFAYMLKNLAPPNFEALLKEKERLREALEKLARLGNGEHYGNSDGNCIAIEALKKGEG